MFWKINFRPTSAIDGLLDKEDCTLNEILDEDDVLQEVKSQNKKLVEFLQKEDNLETLVKYACVVSEPDLEDKYKFKYPHLACEILTADVFTIVEALATAEKFLPMLWNFLHHELPLNPLIASFNSKILAMLLGQRTTLFLEYIQKIEGFVDHFLKHLGTSAMMDLLLQMIAAPEGDQGRQDVAMWLSDEGVIEKLIGFVTASSSVDQCVNSSQALCDILRISRESAQMSGPGPLLKTLENEETIKKLLDNMFSVDDPPDWVIINGTYVLLTALEKRNYGSSYSPTFSRSYLQSGGGGGGEEVPPVDQSTEKIITNIVPCVKLFHNLLNRKPQCETMVMTVGVLDPPLGNMRLQVVRLFSALLHSHDTRIQKEIILNSTLTVLLDLFFQYPWNNFLHTQVESCIIAGLSSVSPVTMEMDNGTGQPNNTTTLRQHLLSDSKLVQRLLDGARKNEELIGSSEINGTRLGFMGHLVRMANQISGNDRLGHIGGVLERAREEAATTATVDDERLQGELDRDTYEKWAEFISGPIAEMNKKNDTNLGGSRPLTSSIDDSDEEFDPLHMGPDNEFEKAFQQYQDSRFSTILIEDFGLNDALDPAPVSYSNTYTALTSINCTVEADELHTQLMAGFEACCSERIHPFDDTDSEDEEESSPWADKEISFVSSLGQRSFNSTSEEDEEDETRDNKEKGRRREFPTESSDDEDSLKLLGGKDRLIIVEGKERNSEPNEIGVISWRSEFSTDEDLSRRDPNDWTQEPPAATGGGGGGADDEKWADFSTFSTEKVKEDTVVSVTYVSVKELESESAGTVVTSSASIQVSGGGVSEREGQYTRISSTGSIGSVGSEEDMIVDNNLLQSNDGEEEEGDDSDHSSSNNSSDEDRSVNYGVTDGESGNPLLNESSDVSIEETETTPTNNEEKVIEGVVTESSNS